MAKFILGETMRFFASLRMTGSEGREWWPTRLFLKTLGNLG